jgi:hypothetical protein
VIVPVATEWADTFREGIQAFSRSRRVDSPAVQVTLADGESFFLMRESRAPVTTGSACTRTRPDAWTRWSTMQIRRAN